MQKGSDDPRNGRRDRAGTSPEDGEERAGKSKEVKGFEKYARIRGLRKFKNIYE